MLSFIKSVRLSSTQLKVTTSVFKCNLQVSLDNSFACSTDVNSKTPVDHELQEIFKFKDTNISNWIIENKVKKLCCRYQENGKEDRQKILHILASQYAVQHNKIYQAAKKFDVIEPNDTKQMIVQERNLKTVLIPPYHWLFVIMGRLEHGVKFLVDLRTDVLELMTEVKNRDEYIVLQQLNLAIKDLLLLWFSVGFLHLERITWQSPCDILQKVSEYEAIHPIRNWLDLKKRVGPYRRCYIFTHPSMPREPLVLLHTALCDEIPSTVKGIEDAENRILGGARNQVSFLEEDKSKIKAVVFYSIASTQKGLQGIELGNYMIKEVAKEITTEFPMVNLLSTLSPIPNFRVWLLEKMKQDITQVFSREEQTILESLLNSENLFANLNKVFSTSLWTGNKELADALKIPLLRLCARYLYKEKRRNYALNSVANFHLRNGAAMWRINWLADPSPRGMANSCGIMVNYRYPLNECESNSQNYIENYIINACEDVKQLAAEAEKLKSR